MKQFFVFLLLSVLFFQTPLFGQDANSAAGIAQKQEAEERYKRISADVESLHAANLALQKKVSALEAELQKVSMEQARSANNNTSESLKKLADAIQEVDKNRVSDKQKILEEISRMAKSLSTPAPNRSPPKTSVTPDTGSSSDKGFPHVIKSGETLGAIVSDYNAAFKEKGMKTITQKQVMAANPSVEWNRLKIGQKIFVPAPVE
ncbi:MAG: LysM peptidoglycan-binding domain-containing protein [Verrucomicrobiota bacterium]